MLMNFNKLAKATLPLLLFTAASCNKTPNDSTNDNKAVVMDGSSTRLVVDVTPDLKLLSNSFTIEAWVTANPNFYFQTILEKRSYPVVGDYWIGLDRTGVWRMTVGDYEADLYGTTQAVAGQKYHVAGVFDRSTGECFLYVNGQLEATGTVPSATTMINSNEPLYIGASKTLENSLTPENINGKLDEIRIWCVARSQSVIATGMNKTLKGDESSLVAYWNFDQGSVSAVADQTGKGHTARVEGNVEWVDSPFGLD